MSFYLKHSFAEELLSSRLPDVCPVSVKEKILIEFHILKPEKIKNQAVLFLIQLMHFYIHTISKVLPLRVQFVKYNITFTYQICFPVTRWITSCTDRRKINTSNQLHHFSLILQTCPFQTLMFLYRTLQIRFFSCRIYPGRVLMGPKKLLSKWALQSCITADYRSQDCNILTWEKSLTWRICPRICKDKNITFYDNCLF